LHIGFKKLLSEPAEPSGNHDGSEGRGNSVGAERCMGEWNFFAQRSQFY